MASWYSSAFSSKTAAVQPEPGFLAAEGLVTRSFGFSRFAGSLAMVSGEAVAWLPVDPSDRIRALWLSTDGAWSAGVTVVLSLGVYRLAADRSLGSVLDASLFASSWVIMGVPAKRSELFHDGFSLLADADRMKPLWELVSLGASGNTYARPPNETWALASQLGYFGSLSAVGPLLFEAEGAFR